MKHILIVDDTEENRYLLKILLAGHGYEAETAIHGAEALEKALQNPPDMIISDILMPVMDGFALCSACKKDEHLKSIPFIFYTATYTDPRDERLALGMGADAFIVKPMDPAEFLKRIETILRTHEGESLITPQKQTAPEEVILKEYNEALIRKLEQKMLHLERANKTLEVEIASRTRAEAALRDSEERYRSLFENSMDGVLLTVPDGEVLKANPAACSIFIRSEEEIRNVGREGVVDLSDPRLEKALAERQHTGRFSGELTFVRKDGTKFPGEISSAIFKDSAGKLKTSMIIRDISARKHLEDVLEKKAAQWQQTFDATNDAIWLLDDLHRILRANQTTEKLFHRPPTDVIGKYCWEVAHGTDAPVPDCPAIRAMKSRKREVLELQSDGRWYRATVDPIFDEKNGSQGSVHMITDITEWQRTKDHLRTLTERFNMALEASRTGTWDWDVVTGRIEWSRQMFDLFGLDAATDLPSFATWEKVLHSQDLQIAKDRIAHALQHHTTLDNDYRIVLRDGSIRWINAVGKGQYDDSGSPTSMIGICVDITEKKLALEQIRQLNAELERKVAERTRELQETIGRLEDLNRVFVGRELKMIELKKKIEELEKK